VYRDIDGWLDNYEPLAAEYEFKKNLKNGVERRYNSVVVKKCSDMGDRRSSLFG